MQAQSGQQPSPPVAVNLPVLIMAVTPVTPTTCHAAYLPDQQFDTFQGNYINLYSEYATPGDVHPCPFAIWFTKREIGVPTSIAWFMSWTWPKGLQIQDTLHRLLTRHDLCFGQVPLLYNGAGLAFFGDNFNGQVPTTVTLSDNWFNHQIGPFQVLVPTHGLLAQEMAAHPKNHDLFGSYQAGQGADVVETVNTRTLVLIPNCYAVLFLTSE